MRTYPEVQPDRFRNIQKNVWGPFPIGLYIKKGWKGPGLYARITGLMLSVSMYFYISLPTGPNAIISIPQGT